MYLNFLWCQCIIGFERDKQADGLAKNLSVIRLLKERNYGQTGVCYTKYISETGRLVEREDFEVDEDNPFVLTNGEDAASLVNQADGASPW